jgi:hypothetical protein
MGIGEVESWLKGQKKQSQFARCKVETKEALSAKPIKLGT